MEDVDNRGGCAGGIWEISVPSFPFYCEPQTTLNRKMGARSGIPLSKYNPAERNIKAVFVWFHYFIGSLFSIFTYDFSDYLDESCIPHKMASPPLCKNRMLRKVYIYPESHNKDLKKVAFRFGLLVCTYSTVSLLLLLCCFFITTNI